MEKCEYCGREGVKETAQTIDQNDMGLTWLYPDEKWICNTCLRNLSLRAPASKN